MDRFEYAVGLISLIVGLALADIAVSLHRLIKRRGSVRWSAFSIIAVIVVSFQCVGMWYDIWSLRRIADQFSIFFYITLLLELFLLFLGASAVLPDEREDGWDLVAYHETQRHYLWTIMSLFFAAYGSHWLYFVIISDRAEQILSDGWEAALPLLCSLVLIRARRAWLKVLTVAALLAALIASYARAAF